jgi:hypothetical protein
MKKIEILAATNLEDAVYELKRMRGLHKEECFADFNGKEIFSTDTMDEAYNKVVGCSKTDFDKKLAYQTNEREKLDAEHEARIPELTKYWIDEGHKHLSSEYWELWDKCVPVRLGDLYKGMELDCVIKLVRILNASENIDDTYQAAKKEIKSQGHIRSFHKNGSVFIQKLSIE